MVSRRLSSVLAVSSLFALTTAAMAGAPSPDRLAEAFRVATDLGRVEAERPITLTIRLKLPDQAAFDRTVDALYERGSPRFHQWLTDADLQRFAPPQSHIDEVRRELERNGLTVLSVDRNGFSMRASGRIADVERAFGTEIHWFDRHGETFRAPVKAAALRGPAAAHVAAVAGLESHRVRPMLSRAVNLKTKQPFPSRSVAEVEAAGGLTSIITDQSLSAPTAFTFSTPGAELPTGVYYGNVYDVHSKLTPDFTSKELQAIYGLTEAYSKGLDGTGETVVLLEGYGYPTIEADANAFSKLNGLPALTKENFSIVYPEGKPIDPNAGVLTGWDIEIALDVQWAHSMAPGAKIVVVATNGQDSEDFEASIQYIVDHHIGNSVSDSWEEDTDLVAGPDEQESFEKVLQVAAAKGVSFQFSTGDGGDGGLGSPIGAAGVPSVAPHATAVGGTAILNKLVGKGYESVGWGDSAVFIAADGPLIPPESAGLLGGGGGGESVYFKKPAWQASLPGTGRQTPDISALADPYTGVPIVITSGGKQSVQVGWGGTSLASPIFTAIWAIANQKAGHPLGQASPTIAALTTGVTDVLPQSSPTDVTGVVIQNKGSTYYSATGLFGDLVPDDQAFTSAIWNLDPTDSLAFGFALDSSLVVTKGWDNATGYGTPDGLTFINAAAALK